MAPKKGEEAPKRVLLGRPSNNVKMGIVGLPNVGKSSLFNILSKLSVPAENFPFCTIDPNVARIPVPDLRFKELVKMYQPKNEVPAMLTVTDIAGLVKGASEGAGLGNAFLSHIQAVDGIYHVCRAFDNADVTHVEDSVDPVRDLEIIHNELRKKDIKQCNSFLEANKKQYDNKALKKDMIFEYDTIAKAHAGLMENKDVRALLWDSKEIDVLNKLQFLTAKPMIYLANISKSSYIAKGNKWLPKIEEYVKSRGCDDLVLPFSVTFEQECLDAETGGGIPAKQAFMKEAGARTIIPMIIKSGYSALNLIRYFTAGKAEVAAWSIKLGTLAPQAAGVIHTDFEKGFVCADVMNYDDLMELKSEAAVKSAGKLLMKGKTYEVVDGDIMHFKINK
mmetsp:Transcript_2278/g.3802  ORF Transcript_2278/g.3802 Transcript_2278/m.3802 type:complete len:392 (+) Transcript_2278:77-1252(+)|eukprot:CAMPEP_0184523812 /NCGR_PEP_ID=MMETSP0198_2-20121128/9121_1 /TAXON_ID=1112570 /ORGANISM="Thraustochytrium sp., Strain LLF1b" /LENGTH=391 /DNA_ID=CAMNT_0026914943 /DNA_START=79 /DNA_END=1254 /DNA_ORIENTATION=-